jgi:MFS transporter, CP family, cyanate transporter
VATAAGSLVGILNLTALPSSLLVPWLSDRAKRRYPHVITGAVLLSCALMGLLLVPEAAVVWAALAGMALGGLFPLALSLPVDFGRSGTDVAGLAAVTLAGGYTLASIGPTALGWIRDTTGSFDAALVVLAVSGIALMALAWGLRRSHASQT